MVAGQFGVLDIEVQLVQQGVRVSGGVFVQGRPGLRLPGYRSAHRYPRVANNDQRQPPQSVLPSGLHVAVGLERWASSDNRNRQSTESWVYELFAVAVCLIVIVLVGNSYRIKYNYITGGFARAYRDGRCCSLPPRSSNTIFVSRIKLSKWFSFNFGYFLPDHYFGKCSVRIIIEKRVLEITFVYAYAFPFLYPCHWHARNVRVFT